MKFIVDKPPFYIPPQEDEEVYYVAMSKVDKKGYNSKFSQVQAIKLHHPPENSQHSKYRKTREFNQPM